MKLNEKQRENCLKIVKLLRDDEETFPWSDSDEGFAPWDEVCKKLLKYSIKPKPKICKECGRPYCYSCNAYTDCDEAIPCGTPMLQLTGKPGT